MIETKGNIYNIYCDESRVENPEYAKMVIGALFLKRTEKDRIVSRIKSLFEKHKFPFELKWIKTSAKYVPLYKDILGYFIEEKDLQYRCIIVNKAKIDYAEHHNNDSELAFFKFYYLMLRTKLLNNKKYYIFLDKKPTWDKNRARALLSFLNSYILLHKEGCAIEHLQAYESEENVLIQIADYLTGLVAHACNRGVEDTPKGRMITHLAKQLEREDVCQSTPVAEEKFNVFVWKPN